MPLITVFFTVSVMLTLVPPDGVFEKLLRTLFGIVRFPSAYMAEVVRGGL